MAPRLSLTTEGTREARNMEEEGGKIQIDSQVLGGPGLCLEINPAGRTIEMVEGGFCLFCIIRMATYSRFTV